MAYETTDELLAEISDYWDKSPDSNLYKLIGSLNDPLEAISDNGEKVEEWRALKDAEGTTLDLFGKDIETYRPGQNDDNYRFLIHIMELLSRAQGTIPSIVKIASNTLQDDEGFKVWKTGIRHVAIQIPYDAVSSPQMVKFILKNLQKMLAMGYWLDMIVFKSASPLSLYIGVGDQDTWQDTQETDMVWWTGWKSKTAGDLHIGIGTNANDSTIWSSDTVWWSGWKAQTTPASYICIAGRYVNSSVWSTELINS